MNTADTFTTADLRDAALDRHTRLHHPPARGRQMAFALVDAAARQGFKEVSLGNWIARRVAETAQRMR